jgi:hypothetical protein
MTTIEELDNIRKTANLYAEGLQQGNVDLLKKAFHPQAMMYGPGMIVSIQGMFDYVNASPAPEKSGEPHQCFITKIDCTGNAASVEMAQQSYQGINYINYFQLLKLDGQWVIVSKSFDVLNRPEGSS